MCVSRYAYCHLAQCLYPIGIAAIVGHIDLSATNPVVHNFLLISEITQVSAHHRPKFFTGFPGGLDCIYADHGEKKNDATNGEFCPEHCDLFSAVDNLLVN
jgi:hypothetical protein